MIGRGKNKIKETGKEWENKKKKKEVENVKKMRKVKKRKINENG